MWSMTEIIGFATLGTSIIVMVGFVLKNSREEGAKRNRIYARLDEEKDEVAKTYVRQDIHQVKYDHMNESVTEIKMDVKKLLAQNGLK